MDERRKEPRRRMESDSATLPGLLNVRVLDIAPGGVLLQAARPVPVGSAGTFRVNLAGVPFCAQMRVERVTPAPGGSLGYRIGATFVHVAPADQQVIEQFVGQ